MADPSGAVDVYRLPDDLPVPVDDGACRHLAGLSLPDLTLRSSRGRRFRLRKDLPARAVIFFFPAAGRPGVPLPDGWDQIPGARGCTPQACAYRDRYSEFLARGYGVVGVSSQTVEDLTEIGTRNRYPFELLSDADLALAHALRLPTFSIAYAGTLFPPVCIRRVTLRVQEGRIDRAFYPVFPPNRDAEQVLATLP